MTKRNLTLFAALASMLAFAASHAQEAPESDEDDADIIENIVVTGSRIRRTGDAPVPFQVISPESFATSGFTNLGDFLQDTPALQGSFVIEDTTDTTIGAAGLNFIALRNIGFDRTLVLVNGRRHIASSAFGQAFDTNTIPQALLKSVEVVTGGASSIYGADATAGVVNFILKEDFEGIEFDGIYTNNQEGVFDSAKFEFTAGKNFADGRGNFTFSLGYREDEELFAGDLDFEAEAVSLITTDFDPIGPDGIAISDGIPNQRLVPGSRNVVAAAGGAAFLFGGTPGFGDQFFNLGPGGTVIQTFDPNVPFLSNTNPERCFTFDDEGNQTGFLPADQIDPGCGAIGPLAASGLATPTGTRFADGSVLPESENITFNNTFRYDITENIRFKSEAKYVYSKNSFETNAEFFNNGIGDPSAIASDAFVGFNNGASALPFFAGFPIFTATDNAFISDDFEQLIEAGVPNATIFGGPVGGLNFASFQRNFEELGSRQEIEREVFRIVAVLEGQTDTKGFISDLTWDVGVNIGRSDTDARRLNTRSDIPFFAAADAIQVTQANLDAIAAAGNTASCGLDDVICRAQLLSALGATPTLQLQTGGLTEIDAETVANCDPINLFEAGGIRPDQVGAITEDLNDRTVRDQLVIDANLSGSLPDFWGAGTIGFATGLEYRREDSNFRGDQTPLVRPTFQQLQESTRGDFDVYEAYLELDVPIATDIGPGLHSLSVNGSLRYSDYSSIGNTRAWSGRLNWAPIKGLDFRLGEALAIRAPNIPELFQAPTATFTQIVDPCSQPQLAAPGAGPNRAENCAQLVPDGFFDPGPGVANLGFNVGNEDLQEERARTFFAGVTYTPEAAPNFNVVVDYYDIRITESISAFGAQRFVDECVDGDAGLIENICNLITRSPITGEITTFSNPQINSGFVTATGYDIALDYTAESRFGTWNINVKANNIQEQDTLIDPTERTTLQENAGLVGIPEWRAILNANWSWQKIELNYRVDWINSQNVLLPSVVRVTPDLDLSNARTGNFTQHDLTAIYQLTDQIALRFGIVNIADEHPPFQAQDNLFDFFGRRFFAGFNVNLQ